MCCRTVIWLINAGASISVDHCLDWMRDRSQQHNRKFYSIFDENEHFLFGLCLRFVTFHALWWIAVCVSAKMNHWGVKLSRTYACNTEIRILQFRMDKCAVLHCCCCCIVVKIPFNLFEGSLCHRFFYLVRCSFYLSVCVCVFRSFGERQQRWPDDDVQIFALRKRYGTRANISIKTHVHGTPTLMDVTSAVSPAAFCSCSVWLLFPFQPFIS